MRSLGVLCLIALAAAAAWAAVPQTLSYQGVLRDDAGDVVPDADYTITFALYSTETGGTPLWTETQSVPVERGLLNVILGSTEPLTLSFDSSYWLGMSVAGEPELEPRVELTAGPYAFRAVYTENIDTSIVAGDGLIDDGPELAVNPGPGLEIAGDAVGLGPSHQSGSAFDDRFVNEGQPNSITTAMIVPDIVSSVDGVVNDGGNIDLIAGANVTITPDDPNNTITISATGTGVGGSGTPDNIAKFTAPTTLGDSIMRESGGGIVIDASKAADDGQSDELDAGRATRLPSKLSVYGYDGWTIYGDLLETDTATDGRTAILGVRHCSAANAGGGYGWNGANDTNNAVTGYNDLGTMYSFGVAGYTNWSVPLYNTDSGGVLGANHSGSTWGALAYRDHDSGQWGVYTPNDAYVGGSLSIGSGVPTFPLSVSGDAYVTGKLGVGPGIATPLQDLHVQGHGYVAGDLGVGVATPAQKLDVNGTAQVTGFRMPTGAGSGKVLTSNASGVGTWQSPSYPSVAHLVDTHDEGATTIIEDVPTQYDDAQVTIDVPSGAAGYIVVTSNVWCLINRTFGETDALELSHSTSPTLMGPYYSRVSWAWADSLRPGAIYGGGTHVQVDYTFSVHSTHYVGAGTHTYYLVGRMTLGQDPSDWFWWAQMTAVFYPTTGEAVAMTDKEVLEAVNEKDHLRSTRLQTRR